MTTQELDTFFAAVKKTNYTKPVSFTIKAPTVAQAIDYMYHYAGAASASDIEEYELFKVVDNTKYIPVSAKFKQTTPVLKLVDKPLPHNYYTSYKDIA